VREYQAVAPFFFLIVIVGVGIQLGPLDTATTNRPTVPAPGDYDDGQISGMIGRGYGSTRRKPAPVPLCSPQTPHAARTRTRTAVVGSQRLPSSTTARTRGYFIVGFVELKTEVWQLYRNTFLQYIVAYRPVSR
jgi:hypothetical protein